MADVFDEYVERALAILAGNRVGSSTKPAPSLYPHQWNWDSGFISIGRSHFDPAGAMRELETLFEAQWANGMLPQIVFNPDALGHYFPEPDFWRTEGSPHAPKDKLTSGVTMPPIHGVAVEMIAENAPNAPGLDRFLRRIYPKLVALHEYLYRERDPDDEGLVYIRHPWESGIDNSPTWDGPLKRIRIDRDALPPYERKDLGHGVDPENRPSDDDYDRYVLLVDLFRRNDYDEERIRPECPFLIQDPLFNSILCRSNQALVRIAEELGEDPERPRIWGDKTAAAMRDKLWHEDHGIFDAYDLVEDKVIEVDTAGGFLPLFAGAASREQAERIYRRLNSASFCALHQGNCYTIPNYDTEMEEFDRDNYWRGPVWININWMLAHGLARYGYTLKADSLRKDLLQLPIRFGFHEYFDSFDGRGYGSDNFSWTAALFIDIVKSGFGHGAPQVSLVDRIKAVFTPPQILNSGTERPDIPPEDLSAQLMKAVGDLRNRFYDTKRGRVDYDRLKDSDEFRRYRTLTNGLRSFEPASLVGRRTKTAFWINLYNTIIVDGVASTGVRQSVKEVADFFRSIAYDIGGILYTPDDIEHGILRGNVRPYLRPFKQFGLEDPRREWIVNPVDPRIHFGLVCGSRSCAPIDYYDADTIDRQLDEAAKSFINSSEVVLLPEERKILLSEIFKWYEDDFGGRVGVLDFIHDFTANREARDAIRSGHRDLEIEYIYYDWNLNR